MSHVHRKSNYHNIIAGTLARFFILQFGNSFFLIAKFKTH